MKDDHTTRGSDDKTATTRRTWDRLAQCVSSNVDSAKSGWSTSTSQLRRVNETKMLSNPLSQPRALFCIPSPVQTGRTRKAQDCVTEQVNVRIPTHSINDNQLLSVHNVHFVANFMATNPLMCPRPPTLHRGEAAVSRCQSVSSDVNNFEFCQTTRKVRSRKSDFAFCSKIGQTRKRFAGSNCRRNRTSQSCGGTKLHSRVSCRSRESRQTPFNRMVAFMARHPLSSVLLPL